MKALYRLLCALLFWPVLPPLSAATPPPGSVEQWGVFDLALDGPATGNPFLDVKFAARFTQGTRSLAADGFYDGDGVYRVRFMPDATGEWRYETVSDRPELNGRTGTFAATAPGKNNHGPVRVARTFHFDYADGAPYRQIGTTSYSWAHQADDKAEQTLQTLAASPFNKVRMCVLPPGQVARPMRWFPFAGTPPKAWDKTRFDPAFFRNLERRVGQLRDLGIEADLILFNPYDKIYGFGAMTAAEDDRYVRYVVARFAAFRNVWWSLSNEYDFNPDKTEADWDRIGQLVRSADPYGRMLSIHNGFKIYNHTHPWITHAGLQQGAAVLDPERAMIYRDVYRKPIVFDEVKYEGNNARRWGQLKGEEMVLRFWSGTVAGTYVGHGEAINRPGVSGGAFVSAGGTFKGESVARIAFLKTILDDSPPTGLDPIDKWQDRHMAGKPGDYYLVYFGEQAPASWPFVLYKTGLGAGVKFSAEVIDTWNMTITPVEGLFELKKRDNYDFVDKDGRSVPLPGKPYMAIRLKRVGPPAANAASADQIEP